MDNSDTMKQVYLLAQQHCGLKVGDFVKVTREAKNYEAGWDKIWDSYKSQAVGFIGRIIGDSGSFGFRVRINGAACECDLYFPFFVLAKVEKPAHKFKPFDKVLVRDKDDEEWKPQLFSCCVDDEPYIYYTLAEDSYAQCIPYEGNEHLVGTTDNPEE